MTTLTKLAFDLGKLFSAESSFRAKLVVQPPFGDTPPDHFLIEDEFIRPVIVRSNFEGNSMGGLSQGIFPSLADVAPIPSVPNLNECYRDVTTATGYVVQLPALWQLSLGESQMFLWWSVFVAPFAASTLEWAILSSRRRDQLRHVTVILAMTSTTMAALLGIWMLIHFPKMLVPANTGHKVVSTGCLLAALGGFAALTWVVIERHWLSWMALAISGWMIAVWMLMLLGSD